MQSVISDITRTTGRVVKGVITALNKIGIVVTINLEDRIIIDQDSTETPGNLGETATSAAQRVMDRTRNIGGIINVNKTGQGAEKLSDALTVTDSTTKQRIVQLL